MNRTHRRGHARIALVAPDEEDADGHAAERTEGREHRSDAGRLAYVVDREEAHGRAGIRSERGWLMDAVFAYESNTVA